MLLLDLLDAGIEALAFAVSILPAVVLAYLMLTVSAGHAGRLLRRGGRLGGMVSLGGVLGAVYFVLFTTVSVVVSEWTPPRLPIFLFALVDVAGSAAVTGLIVVATCAALPRRRRTGPKPKINTVAAYSIGGLGCLFAVAAPVALLVLVFSEPTSGWLDRATGSVFGVLGALALIVVGLMIIAIAAQLYPSGSGLPSGGRSRSVLFIRPFDAERRTFWISDVYVRDTVEGFLGPAIAARIGPLIALGNPADRVPPSGASRAYHADTDWREAVERLVEQAGCILTTAHMSPNTGWELSLLLRTGQHRKLFVVTPPAEPRPRILWDAPAGTWRGAAKIRIIVVTSALCHGRFGAVPRAISSGLPARPAIDSQWPHFAAALTHAGYLPGDDPGPGSVLAFEENGAATVLARGATEPIEYVDAIRHRLVGRAA